MTVPNRLRACAEMLGVLRDLAGDPREQNRRAVTETAAAIFAALDHDTTVLEVAVTVLNRDGSLMAYRACHGDCEISRDVYPDPYAAVDALRHHVVDATPPGQS